MNQLVRIVLIVYSFILAILSIILLYALIDDTFFANLLSPLSSVVTDPIQKYIYLIVMIVVLASAVFTARNF